MQDRPIARSTRLLVEELDGELMVFDQDANAAHVLSDDVARVWQRCDGEADVERIAADLALDDERVRSALDELRVCGLLSNVGRDGTGYSRRDAVKKVAKVGAAAAAVPLIYSLAIGPAAAMASPVTCHAQNCSQTASDGASAKAGADHDCNGALVTITVLGLTVSLPGGPPASGCQLGSVCGCTPAASGGNFVCSGTCTF